VAGKLERTTPFVAGMPDTVRVLGIRVDFENDSLGPQTSTPDGRFDMRDGKSLGMVIDPPPHDRGYFMAHMAAMSRYWRDQSFGNLVITYDVYPHADSSAYRLRDTGTYGPWTLGAASYQEAQRFFRDGITAADQSDTIPWDQFDVIILFHAGSDFQADVLGDSQRDIPTFQIGLNDSVAVSGGAFGVHGGIVMPETENQDGYLGALNGTMAHEFGHTQGLPDLYDINTFFPAVGVWSNMDSGYLLGSAIQVESTGEIVLASGILPVSLDPWCKTTLWPDGIQTVDPGHALSTSLRSSQLSSRVLKVPLGSDEYLLVENRQADLNGDNSIYLDRDSTSSVILGPGLSSTDPSDSLGNKEYDFLLPGQGVLMWHIDETVICTPLNDSTYTCGPNANPDLGVNSNPERRGVRLMEADGIADIGNPNSAYFFGSPFDPYFVGNHTRLDDDTNPSAKTNDGARSHVRVDVLSAPAVDMAVTVDSEWRLQGWPVSADSALVQSSPTYGSFLHDGTRSVVTAADSLIFAWAANGTPWYTSHPTGEWVATPRPIVLPVLFADSLYRPNALVAAHGSAIVATCTDGRVYAYRPGPRNGSSIPISGWPPVLDTNAPSVIATTPPVLAPGGGVIVGGSDGRVFVITPSEDPTQPPRVTAISDTLLVGGSPVVSAVSSNLAVGRFVGAGGYEVAYALDDGTIRIVEQTGKSPERFEASWHAGAPGFTPYLLGVDIDRAEDRHLELIAVDVSRGTIHCFDMTGAELPGWPVVVPGGLAGPVAAGDMDGDGYPEILAIDLTGYAHRLSRNGVERQGWPVSLAARYGPSAVGGTGSPILGDVDQDGRPEALFALDNGLLVALEPDGRGTPGWPISVPGAADDTPLLLSLNGTDLPPDPPGPPWVHLVAGGGFDGSLGGYQLPAHADSALFTSDGVSARFPWQEWGGNRRRSSVLEDSLLITAAPVASALDPGSVYCYPNPARGNEIGVAYTLGEGVTEVIIRVLDPTGREVERLTPAPEPTQNVARILLNNLASGVYVVRVEAKRGGASDVAFQKFAVVR
jgi:M6 family metalloprotease-like protein